MQQATESTHPGSGLAIAIGTVVDGAAEGIVLGIETARSGGPPVALLIAFMLGNFPEALSATAGMDVARRSRRYIFAVWVAAALFMSAIAALSAAFLIKMPAMAPSWIDAFAAGSAAFHDRGNDDPRSLSGRGASQRLARGGRICGAVAAARRRELRIHSSRKLPRLSAARDGNPVAETRRFDHRKQVNVERRTEGQRAHRHAAEHGKFYKVTQTELIANGGQYGDCEERKDAATRYRIGCGSAACYGFSRAQRRAVRWQSNTGECAAAAAARLGALRGQPGARLRRAQQFH